VIARLAALLLIVGMVLGVQRLIPATGAETVALPLGFALIAAYLLGTGVERIGLPRLSGYLLFGLLCGPYVLNLITARMARDLQVVNGLALALIALIAGLELNLRRLRPHLRDVLTIGGVVLLGTMTALTVLLWVAWPMLPFGSVASDGRLAAAFLTAALVASFSPTVTIAVIAESRARGRLTDLIMAIVVIADLLLILLFALALQLARWALATEQAPIGFGAQLSWEILGSLAFGGIIGAAFAAYLRTIGREVTLTLLGVCALLAIVAPLVHFELILAALAAGLVVENVAPPEGDELREAIERGALPVLVAFFAATGASLQLDVLASFGTLALALAALRLALIWSFSDVTVRFAAAGDARTRLVWRGLISQAGVTLGLATILAAEFPGWGPQVRVLVVALTGIHVLIGPILLKAALERAGEVPTGDLSSSSAPVSALE
jgi:Kef-type K+ transport system membrane component KefB